MKFTATLTALSALFAPAAGLTAGSMQKEMHHDRDVFLGPSLWIVGSTGLNIYSPDGSDHFVQTAPEDICHNVTGYRGGPPSLSCSFYDIVSDGKKYVWAAVSRGIAKIDVFDIDTGAVVGSFESCETPRDLEYHPLRDEIWVRCMGTTDEFSGYMDVFSTSSPTGDTIAQVDLTGNHTFSAYGYSIIDNSLGDVGYGSVWNQNTMYKFDLSSRAVIDQFEVPGAYGAYEVAYSKKNQHIFIRASVCCSCGFVGSDLGEDCGRYGSDNVTLTTGPNAGKTMQGQCGRCDGLPIDSIGVLEFNTQTDTFIGSHAMKDGTGGDPFGSPDGRHIVLVGRNGGETLRILETGENGQLSTVGYDLELGFDATDEEDSAIFNDFAFIQTDGSDDGVVRDLIVIAAGTENVVALVDLTKMSNGMPTVTKLNLSANDETTSNRNRRQVEWVIGTKYVWIDGTANDEVYVVDIDSKSLVRTITGLSTSKMISVENYERKNLAKLISAQIDQARIESDKAAADKAATDQANTVATQSNLEAALPVDSSSDDDSKIDPIGIVALIVGVVAVVVGAANLVAINKMNKFRGSSGDTNALEVESLGSKNVA